MIIKQHIAGINGGFYHLKSDSNLYLIFTTTGELHEEVSTTNPDLFIESEIVIQEEIIEEETL